jgi:hypothetical protein
VLAIVAAIFFGLALLLDLADADIGTVITNATLVTAGLLCVALHLAGVGGKARSFNLRRRRTR